MYKYKCHDLLSLPRLNKALDMQSSWVKKVKQWREGGDARLFHLVQRQQKWRVQTERTEMICCSPRPCTGLTPESIKITEPFILSKELQKIKKPPTSHYNFNNALICTLWQQILGRICNEYIFFYHMNPSGKKQHVRLKAMRGIYWSTGFICEEA